MALLGDRTSEESDKLAAKWEFMELEVSSLGFPQGLGDPWQSAPLLASP